jgi:hypothetical protein
VRDSMDGKATFAARARSLQCYWLRLSTGPSGRRGPCASGTHPHPCPSRGS